jgi:hypothetical protein
MTTEERKAEIIGTNGIEASELEHKHDNMFSSIEYYLIMHMTNAELYYGYHLTECFDAECVEVIDTEKGRIFYVK